MSKENIRRRTYLAGLTATGIAGLAGCTGNGTATGTLATQVTDQPGDIGDFESCVVTVVGMWLGPAGSDDDDEEATADETETNETVDEDSQTSGGREYHEYDEPQEADLVQLQGEQTQLVDERELDVAEYAFLQLDTDGVEATLEDGTSADVQVPGEAPLTFNEAFEIRAETRTTFTADFMPVRRGETGSYNLQPVPQGITVSYDETES